MLKISQDNLPQTFLSYIAFRVSFLETLERVALAKQFEMINDRPFGFLTEVPFLQSVPPQVQLELLLDTWRKHMSPDKEAASLVDESIVYAVCETAAKMAQEEQVFMKRFLRSGPMPVSVLVDEDLASELRTLHLKLSNEGDFLLISQFQDIPPDEAAPLKEQFNFDSQRADSMFDVLGRWNIADNTLRETEYLLTDREIRRAAQVLEISIPKHLRGNSLP